MNGHCKRTVAVSKKQKKQSYKKSKIENLYTMKAFKILTNLFYVIGIALIISLITGLNPAATILFFVLLSFLVLPKGYAFMALQKEIWTKDIIDNLYKDNDFAKRAFSEDEYVLAGKVVHIPVAGSPSAVKKNLNVFPQVAVKRNDSELTYAIDTFYTVPTHVEEIEKFELSYDKRQSVLGEDQSQLIQVAMESLLFRWAPGFANCTLTDGGDVPVGLADAVGNRKAFTKATFSFMKLKMNKANILKKGRVALLTSDHYQQFLDSLSDAEKTNFNNVADLKNGIVGRYLGFDVMERSTVLRYRGADLAHLAVVDELDAAYVADANDRAGSLFYQETCVSRAKGEVKMFDGTDRPEYYGDIFSFILRLGGRIRRVPGVYAVVDELAA